jgi:fatty-acyl-CoA synthase
LGPGRRVGAMRTGLTIGPPEDIRMTIQALGTEELCNVYGSTETYGNCAVTDARDPLELRLCSQGLPLPGMTLRAVNLVTSRPLPQGEIGELAFSGHITPGYYKAPELDAEAFDKDGYFPRVCETSIRERLRPILRATGWPLRPAAY